MVFWYIFSPFWYVVPRKIWQPRHEGEAAKPVYPSKSCQSRFRQPDQNQLISWKKALFASGVVVRGGSGLIFSGLGRV
jgi:hypothetical protein